MPTNILALPLAALDIETGTNEDWIDSVVYVVDSTDPAGPQLDLTGIVFEMELRHKARDHEAVLRATTANGRIVIGAPPDYGYLSILVPLSEMQNKAPGDYVADVVALADSHTRVCLQIALTVVQGVTR